MKRLALGLVIFLGFAVVNGYCNGKKALKLRIADLEKENIILDGRINILNRDKQELQDAINNLRNHRERIAPVTWEIFTEAKERTVTDDKFHSFFSQLDFFLSTPLTLITSDKAREFEPRNRILTIEDKNKSIEERILSTYEGSFIDFYKSPAGRDGFIVSFQKTTGGDVKLQFERDITRNYFFLVAVVDDPSKEIKFNSNIASPYLCIYVDYKNEGQDPMSIASQSLRN